MEWSRGAQPYAPAKSINYFRFFATNSQFTR
jgi:hypothetical protein